MTIKALFTDVDGVLHPAPAILEINAAAVSLSGGAALRKRGLFCWAEQLEEALSGSADDIALIVHSSWRMQPWASLALLREALGPLGHRLEAMTSPNLAREDSILDLCERGGIEDYIILDDAVREFTRSGDRLITTNPLLGVSDPEVLAVVNAWARCEAPRARHFDIAVA